MSLQKNHLYLGLICLTVILAYFSSLNHGFTYLDDQVQVVNNQNIRALSPDHLIRIFNSTSVGMYQPLTTLFYALAYQLDGLSPSLFHSFSLLFHIFNICLVFLLLRKLKIAEWPALLLSCLFALHPMQVESVAWVSAFSNLVFTSFYLLGMISYLNYLIGSKRYQLLFTFLFFVLSCLSKATAISFPLVLLLIDHWYREKLQLKDYLQKVPFLLVSLIFGLITIESREAAGHLSDLSLSFDLLDRVFLISYSILFYPFQFLWGMDLSAFYPYPELENGWLPWKYYLSLPLLLGVVALLYKFRNKKELWLGALFYLFTIGPTLQLVPVGNQLTTDRYIYLPILGLLWVLSLLLKEFKEKELKGLSIVILVIFAFMSHHRAKVWENDKTLWTDVMEKYPKVAQAYNNLGSYLLLEGKKKEAFQHFDKAIELKPYYADAYNNRGNLYSQAGQTEKAMADFNKAIELRPHADAYFNRANELSKKGNFQLALEDYTQSIQLQASPDAYTNRGFVKLNLNKDQEAVADLKQAIKLDPKYHQAYFLLAMEARKRVQFDEACEYLRKAAQYGNQKAAAGYRELCQNN